MSGTISSMPGEVSMSPKPMPQSTTIQRRDFAGP
jgi:hypothetical protein